MITNDRTRTFILILSLILSLLSVFVMYKFVWENLLSRPVPESAKETVKIEKTHDLQYLLGQNTKDILRKMFTEKRKNFNQAVTGFKKSLVDSSVLNINDKAPDFKLDNNKNLYDILKMQNVVLMWYWGDWSSYCNIAFSVYQKIIPEIEKNNGKLVIISPEKNIALTKSKNIEIVFDENNEIAQKFGLVFDVPLGITDFFGINEKIEQLPLPALYVINKQGIIKYAFTASDLKHRADPKDIINALKNIR